MSLRVRSRIGKYRILRKLAVGGYGTVYEAQDTIEGIKVALKVARADEDPGLVEALRREIRLNAKLDHPNILPVKNADLIDGWLIVASPLGIESLADRVVRRLATRTVLSFGLQLLEGLAYAHRHRVMHCDVKPENIILFPGNTIRLADFGLARVARRTVAASGSGTLGYMAPEQALGRPSLRSDVFSAGLVIYRLLTGRVPEWPFNWPPLGFEKVERKAPPGLIPVLRRALYVNHRRRFATAAEMVVPFRRAVSPILAVRSGGDS